MIGSGGQNTPMAACYEVPNQKIVFRAHLRVQIGSTKGIRTALIAERKTSPYGSVFKLRIILVLAGYINQRMGFSVR